MILERAGIVSVEQLKKSRRYAIVGAFAVAAVLTPPDAISQFMLALPLYALYESAIAAIRLTHWRRSRGEGLFEAGDVEGPAKNTGPEAPPGGEGLAVPCPFSRIARAGGQKVTIRMQ